MATKRQVMSDKQLRVMATTLPEQLRDRRRRLAALEVELADLVLRHERQQLRVSMRVRGLKDADGRPVYTNEKTRQEAIKQTLHQNPSYRKRARRIETLRAEKRELEAEVEFLKRTHDGVLAVLGRGNL